MAPSPRPSEARRVAPRAHQRGPQGAGEGRLSPRRLLSHPHRAWLEAWAKGSCPGKSSPRQVPRPLAGSASAVSKNTYSRATQGGSGSGRCSSRWRLQSSRSPRQRQGAGHRRSAATPRPLPSAGPARPNTAHSSSPIAAAGARSLGAPIAVLRPLARPCAPQPARTRSPAPTSSRGWMPALRTACARPPLALPGQLLSFTRNSEAFSCPGAA